MQVRTEELFAMLNALYTAFDDLVDRHIYIIYIFTYTYIIPI